MEPPSGCASRWHVPWSRLLLAVSLLTFRTPPTSAHLTVETVPRLAAEGSDVLLLARNVSENPLGYAWYRGERVNSPQLIASYRVDTNATSNGPVYSGQETLYPNGTLLIRNVTQRDTGPYTLLVTKKDLQTERQTGHLHVHPVLPTPVITSNNSNPREHEDTVVLTCGSETQNTSYMWWINSQRLPKSTRLELSKDKRTLTVVTVTRNDTGPYVCEARNPVSVSRSDPFTLDVLSPVAQPSLQASNATVTEHEGPVILTCLAYETGVSIRWFFKGQSLLIAERMTLSSDNSTLTIDPVSREDTGDYQCEAFNRGNSSRSDPLRLRVTWASQVGLVVKNQRTCLPVPIPETKRCRFDPWVGKIPWRRKWQLTPVFLPGEFHEHRHPSKKSGNTGQENSRGLGVGAITGIVIAVLLVLMPLAVLGHLIFLHRGKWPPASTSGRGPSGSSVSQASRLDARPPAPIYQELLRPDTDVYCHISHKADVGP